MTACKSHWMKVLQLFQRMKRLKLTPVAPVLMGGCFGLTRQLSDKKRQEIQCKFISKILELLGMSGAWMGMVWCSNMFL